MLVQVPATLCVSDLSQWQHVPDGKQGEGGSSTWVSISHAEDPKVFPGSWIQLANPSLQLWKFSGLEGDGRYLSFSLFFSPLSPLKYILLKLYNLWYQSAL